MSVELEQMIEQDKKEFMFERTCIEILKGLENALNSVTFNEEESYDMFFDALVDECSKVYSGVTYDYVQGAYLASGCYSDVRRDAFEFFNALKKGLTDASELFLKDLIKSASSVLTDGDRCYYVSNNLNDLEKTKLNKLGFAFKRVLNMEDYGFVLLKE
jgi:hypothetical protein